MGIRNTKSRFATADGIEVSSRICTPKEASELLKALRTAYQSLAQEDRDRVKSFVSCLLESNS
jgi:hypothetical protein